MISGESNLNVALNESGCKFTFNFADVYWNSRLQSEHNNVVQKILAESKEPKVVCDMMCGIGPFAVPLAKMGAQFLQTI